MKSFCFAIFTLVVLAQAEDGKGKEKRGVADSPSYGSFSSGPSYTKSPQPSPAQQEYVSQTQQYYQADAHVPQSQAVAYAQPAVSKYSVPAVQKIAYSHQPQQHQPQQHQLQQQQPIHYSSAADVSSFSYSSPVVAYNNLGLLQQLAGKAASAQDSPVSYSASGSPKEQFSPAQYSSAPKIQYVSSPKAQYVSAPKAQYVSAPKTQYVSAPAVQYSSAPRKQYSPPQNVQYSSSPSAYSGAPNYEELYQQIAREAAAQSSAAAAAAAEPQQEAYQYNAAPQRQEYAQVPAPATYQTKAASHQVTYDPSPAQQYSFQAPQAQRAPQVPHVTPVYESSAQSAPKIYYSKSAGSASDVPQYYSLPSQNRYSKPGVTYA